MRDCRGWLTSLGIGRLTRRSLSGSAFPGRAWEREATARTLHEKTALQTQIAATDRQIDRLVYDLYGLTEEEIKIVEKQK